VLLDVHVRQRNVGLAAAVSRGNGEAQTFFLGLADLDRRVPVTADTRFGIASVTKAFTGVALLELAQSGRIDLDAPIQKYVPGFPEKPGGVVTPRLLAAHLAGIRHWGPERNEALYARHFDDVMDVIALFKDDPLIAVPGAAYNYSSYGYNLLAAAIQSVAGEPYQHFIERTILTPLRLGQTGFDDVRRQAPGMARRYSFYDPKTFAELSDPQLVPAWDYSHNMAGGNMSSSASDLVRFGRALRSPGLLTPGALEMLRHRPVVNGAASPMSFGWFVSEAAEPRRDIHITGSNAGLQASLYVFPDDDLSIAVLANTWGVGSRSGEMVDLPKRLADTCLSGRDPGPTK
jgi:serine beta-lactamase-like protein LACTB, mitochondrial